MWRLNPPVKFFLTVLKAASKLRSIIIAADFSPYPEGIKFTLIIEILQKRILKLPLASATAQKGRYLLTNCRWFQPLLRRADIFSQIAVGFSHCSEGQISSHTLPLASANGKQFMLNKGL